MSSLTERIEAHALANALKHGGKASPNNVLPKLIGEFPDQKARIRELRAEVERAVARVNALSIDEQRNRIGDLAPELLEKKVQKEKDLPPLQNAVLGKVVTRIPPEPSKYNHIGHALTFLLNAIYAERYEGKVIVRFEDCNPEKVNQEYVDAMLDDIQGYLGIVPAEIRFVSDDIPELLRQASVLIERGGAYVCFCGQETMRAKREAGEECDCRHKPAGEHLAAWERFRAGEYPKGTCVVRFAGDMTSQNTVLRDPVLWRGVETPHFRAGSRYKAWPTYDFYSPIEEHLCGVTHVLRSNEFELRVALQERIKGILGLPGQEVLQYGRFTIAGAVTQGREIRALIESGAYSGWDDPRLVTLKTLRRRGIQAMAYRDLVKQLGLSPYPVTLDFSMLAAANRRIVDPIANRYSLVIDPVLVAVAGIGPHDVTLHLHPDRKNGGRSLRASDRYLVSGADVPRMNGKRVRLMGDCTIEPEGHGWRFVTHDVGKTDLAVNWLPDDPAQSVAVEITMPDATIVRGLTETAVKGLPVGTIIQFERFGFCRLDEQGATVRFWYSHD